MIENGIHILTLSDEQLASIYENRCTTDFNIPVNGYLYVRLVNGEDKNVAMFRRDEESFTRLAYKKIKSKRLGADGYVHALNDEQIALFDLLTNDSVTVKLITGIAGSGKNYCAMAYAMSEIERWDTDMDARYKKLVLVRNNISVKNTQNIGALPSGINEKLLPFAMPAADILGSEFELMEMIEKERIELLHLGFARGRNFDNSIIIVDESENLTAEHVALLISRVGKNSIIMFLGDLKQVDKKVFEENSGIERLNKRLTGNQLFGHVHLRKTERSETAALASLLE